MRLSFIQVALGAALSLLAAACDSGQSSGIDEPDAPNSTPGPYQSNGGYSVHYNQILDVNGNPHQFRGVSRPSLEWNSSGENLSEADFQRMAEWGANVVRVPLNQVSWLASEQYRVNVDGVAAWALAAGLDVILDLHWSDAGGTQQPEQKHMADQGSVAFWQDVATRYQGEGRILFELYNEPHDISWEVWRNGGDPGLGYQIVGMQQLYDTIRGTGANNLVLVGGLDWAFSLSQVMSNGRPRFALDGYNIVYVSHVYNLSTKMSDRWDVAFGDLAEYHPVILTEFGTLPDSTGACGPTQYWADVMNYANQRGLGWVAWAWYPGSCAFPSLITDYSGTPTDYGAVVRQQLRLGAGLQP
jgi:hypothetical protein